MTRSFTHSIPSESVVNRGATALSHGFGQAPRLPRFVDHPELKGRWAHKRLSSEEADPTARHPTVEHELHRFKLTHYYARRMKVLLERHGPMVARRSDYQRFARLHQQLRDVIAFDNVGLVYSLCRRGRFGQSDGDELLGEGMMALTRAIEMFNPWLGFRFSTYACNAILRAVYRCGRRESQRRQRESVYFETRRTTSDWLDTCHKEESSLYVERLGRILSKGTADLTSIEERVLAQRFPHHQGTRRRTLADIGRGISLSKERVRQIEKAALVKLRATLDDDPLLNSKPPVVRSDLGRAPSQDAPPC